MDQALLEESGPSNWLSLAIALARPFEPKCNTKGLNQITNMLGHEMGKTHDPVIKAHVSTLLGCPVCNAHGP